MSDLGGGMRWWPIAPNQGEKKREREINRERERERDRQAQGRKKEKKTRIKSRVGRVDTGHQGFKWESLALLTLCH